MNKYDINEVSNGGKSQKHSSMMTWQEAVLSVRPDYIKKMNDLETGGIYSYLYCNKYKAELDYSAIRLFFKDYHQTDIRARPPFRDRLYLYENLNYVFVLVKKEHLSVKKSQRQLLEIPWYKALSIQPIFIYPTNNCENYDYVYLNKEFAIEQCGLINEIVVRSHPHLGKIKFFKNKDHYINNTVRLPKVGHKMIEAFKTRAKTGAWETEDFFLKMLRFDNFCYFRHIFIYGVTRSDKQQENFKLRLKEKKRYTVYADGVIERRTKKPKYTEKQKNGFSQYQSTTMVSLECGIVPTIFGNKRPSLANQLVGVCIAKKDVLLGRLFTHDSGTVGRRYDHDTFRQAAAYHKRHCIEKPLLHSNLNSFKDALVKYEKKCLNETMARARFSEDGTSKVCIYTDTLRSRLIAQDYARIIQIHLIAKAKENNRFLQTKTGYLIPICFFIPKANQFFTTYSLRQQKEDRDSAIEILTLDTATLTDISEKHYIYLLAYDDTRTINKLHYNNEPLLLTMLQRGYGHIVESLLEKDFLQNYKSIKMTSVQINRMVTIPGRSRKHGPYNGTALHNAVKSGSILCVNWLLKYDSIDISIQDSFGDSALDIAVKNNFVDIAIQIAFLLKSFEAVKNCFIFACKNSTFDIAAKLYDLLLYHNRVKAYKMFLSIAKSDIAVAALWLENQNFDIGYVYEDKTTLLMNFASIDTNKFTSKEKAIYINMFNKIMTNNKTDINATTKHGHTALFFAIKNGKVIVTQMLLPLNANLGNNYKEIYQVLIDSAKKKRSQIVEKILQDPKVDVNFQDAKGKTVLMYVIECELITSIDIILKQPTLSINTKDKQGSTALMYLVNYGYRYEIKQKSKGVYDSRFSNFIKKLLQIKDIDIYSVNEFKDTALSLAARIGYKIAAEQLLEKEMNDELFTINKVYYLIANLKIIQREFLFEGIKASYERGEFDVACMQIKVLYHLDKENINHALIWLSKMGYHNIILELTKYSNFNISFKIDGKTAFFLAAQEGNAETIKVLRNINGVNVNTTDSNGSTPLIIAAQFGREPLYIRRLISTNTRKKYARTCRELLKIQDLKINATDKHGKTAHDHAIESPSNEVLDVLLEYKRDYNKWHNNLMVAASKGDLNTLKELMSKTNIDINYQNKDGETPLICAVKNEQTNIVSFLLSQPKIDVNLRGKNNFNALMWAAKLGNIEIIKILSQMTGIKKTYYSFFGDTVIDIAKDDTVRELLSSNDINEVRCCMM